MITRLRPALLAVVIIVAYLQLACASSSSSQDVWVEYQEPDGELIYLRDDRRPSLYTGNYGDCLGGSLINVTLFDAAYYKDNMTVLFHLAGNTALNNESLVMYIGVFAYGESRFERIFNPCRANIESLCPLNSSIPVSAEGIIPVAPEDLSNIPALALTIPDFEGQAILRIFANSTESEIACYSAVVTNGHSFAQPKSVGTILGLFALTALIASFATAIYGEAVPTMRLHYAHSLSVGVVFAVFQHIYFTGALSMNWPSVLVAWWHNFAWSGGMIYSKSMQRSIDNLIGANIGNTSQVGAAPSDSNNNDVGGGFDPSSIYKRMLNTGFQMPANHPLRRDLATEIYKDPFSAELRRRELLLPSATQYKVTRALQARGADANPNDNYLWHGHPIGSNMPLPGNYSGFAGTLAQEGIGVSNAFMTGFLWFIILLVLLVSAVVAFKWMLELLARYKRIEHDRFQFFRDRWIGYTILVALRICYAAFFLIMFLTMFEFTFQSSAGVKAVAAIVFLVFFIGVSGAAAYACYYKKNFADKGSSTQVEHKKLLGVIPWVVSKPAEATPNNEESGPKTGEKIDVKTPFWKSFGKAESALVDSAVVDNIHDNNDYTSKFGWLASRFRRTRWWFFTAWLFYEFVRAIFYAGASGHPLVQVFGILIVEFIAFVFIFWARPFEGRRLNVLVVYCLGFSKVASVALSAAFDIRFNLPRITTTVIGIVIIVIQGILTIITMVAIAVGAISSYMSISRNRDQFRPRKWHGLREKYFDHLDRMVNDLPRGLKVKKVKEPKLKRRSKEPVEPVEPVEPKSGFEMKGMKRLAKIEDEDEDFALEMRTQDPRASYLSINERVSTPVNDSQTALNESRSEAGTPITRSRAGSMRSLSQTGLPHGARLSRPSWMAQDFVDFQPPKPDNSKRRSAPVTIAQAEDSSTGQPPLKQKSANRRSFSSRSNRYSAPVIRPTLSADSLRIGGAVSTRDTIGDVPMPTVRPRPDSMIGTRSASWHVSGDESDSEEPRLGYQRSSKYQSMMTPAQERDEWTTAPTES